MRTGRILPYPDHQPARRTWRVSPLQLLTGALVGLLLAVAALAAGLRFGDYLIEQDQAGQAHSSSSCPAAPAGRRT